MIITYVLSYYFPWWILAIIGTLIGFCAKNIKVGIYESMTSLTLAWFIKLTGTSILIFTPGKTRKKST